MLKEHPLLVFSGRAHPALTEMALSIVTLDVTMFGHRFGRETGPALLPILGSRLGGLDQLLAARGR